ncbi:MAG: hypothetical protein LBT27_04995, partial [Prevotellaceae bacterium]|nr:hypothetical protein [Prevotellaceae bacterium]
MICIDGKCIKGSKDSYHEQSPIHMVSAWAADNQLVLGQLKVNEKSNEITIITLAAKAEPVIFAFSHNHVRALPLVGSAKRS